MSAQASASRTIGVPLQESPLSGARLDDAGALDETLEEAASRYLVDLLAVAASVTLEQVRGEGWRDQSTVSLAAAPKMPLGLGMLPREEDRARLADRQEATEWGAAGIGVGVANRVLRCRSLRAIAEERGSGLPDAAS